MITQNHNLCEEAKPYYYDHLCDESCDPVPQSVTNHIEQCQHCQKRINRLKVVLLQKECANSGQKKDPLAITTMLKLHFAYIGEHVTCETVRPFLPALLDTDLEIKIPTPITVHLDNCPKCAEDLKTVQELNLNSTQLYRLSRLFAKGPSRDTTEFFEMAAVSAMAERADSEVVTIYHIDQSTEARKTGKSGELYAGFPISVEIIHSDDKVKQPVSTIDFTALKEKVSAMKLKPFLKIVAAAAVLLIGFRLLLNTSTAKAVTLKQIYKALEIVKNVHILKSVPDKTGLITKITEEKWVSRTLNVSMSKTEKGFVLWDVPNRLIKSRDPGTGKIETSQLAEADIPAIEQRISGSLGLMPFDKISEIPPGSQWHRVDGDPEVTEGIEIYELKWAAATYGSSVFKKWKYFIYPKTNLPKRIEVFRKSAADGEYNLISMIEVQYLVDSDEIHAVIKNAGF